MVSDADTEATQLYNWKPKNTRAWRRAASRALTGGTGRINCFGPSTVAGYIGPPGRSETWAWPAQLRRLLARTYGESGTGGVIYFQEPDSRVYAAGFKLDEPYGPYGKSCFSSNTSSALLAFGPIRAAGFRVTYLSVPGSGSFAASVGAGPLTVNTGGPTAVNVALVHGGTVTDRQLRLNPVGNGPVFIIGIEGYAAGVSVTNVGKGSTILADLTNGDPVFGSSVGASVDANPADLSIVAFAENSPGRQLPAAMKADYRVLLDRIRATGSDILLCTSIDWQGESATLLEPQENYDAAIYELADEYDVPLFDIATRWGNFEDSPWYYADNIHPLPMGYADIAAGLHRALHTGI